MPKHNLLIESGSIGADMVGNRFVCRLADKDASRLPEIVCLTITQFECPWMLQNFVQYFMGILKAKTFGKWIKIDST